MLCPICHNTVSSGRCYHSLQERTVAANFASRVIYNYNMGKIDVSDYVKQMNLKNR
jgi:hypothetical protein